MTPEQPLSADPLIAASGLDIGDGVQLCNLAHAAALDPTRPAVVLWGPEGDAAHAFAGYPPDIAVQLIRKGEAGALHSETAPLEQIRDPATPLPANVVAIALPAVPPEQIRHDFRGLAGVIARLRDPETGCPWDLAQDHRSLRPHLLEESHEVLAALDSGDRTALQEELGDLLMQIVLHAQIAQDAGAFDMGDVSEGIRAKLVHRHPHVFSDAQVDSVDAVAERWDQLKAAERGQDSSTLDGVPATLPALARAMSLAGRAARQGFVQPDGEAALGKATEALDDAATATVTGELLFAIADLARQRGIEAEDALREAAARFERRFRALETSLRKAGQEMRTLDPDELRQRWEAVEAEDAASD